MNKETYLNYLKGFNYRKENAIAKIENEYEDNLSYLRDVYQTTFPIKVGDIITTDYVANSMSVTKVEFSEHSCLLSPCPSFFVGGRFVGIKDIVTVNGEPFHYQDYIVEK